MPILEFEIKNLKLRIGEKIHPLSPSGYTLIELMVTLTMISILSVFVFANFRNFAKDQVFIRSFDQIKSSFKQAQNNAATGVKCNGQTASEWSVKIYPSKVSLVCRASSSQTDTVIKTIPFETGISLEEINTKSTIGQPVCGGKIYSNNSPLTVFYKPIDKKIDFIFERGVASECIATSPQGTGPVQLVASYAEFVINYTKGSELTKRRFIINSAGVDDICTNEQQNGGGIQCLSK